MGTIGLLGLNSITRVQFMPVSCDCLGCWATYNVTQHNLYYKKLVI